MTVTDSPAVWRAAAHPLRRRLIELLAGGPRTTGDLARGFQVSRFAVMKHLAVLERSGLIAVNRRGRERWNTLTLSPGATLSLAPAARTPASASPTRAGPAGAALRTPAPSAASPVLELDPPVEPFGPDTCRGADQAVPLAAFRIEQRVLLEASPGRVFDALTFNVSAWWGAPYLRSTAATNVVLEPHLGGRFYEEWGHRQGFIRGSLVAIRQDERLELLGRIAGDGCLPAVLEFRLAAIARGTRLTLLHRGVFEDAGAGPAGRPPFEAAWEELVGRRLKAFVERDIRCGIADRPASPGSLVGWF